MSKRKTSNYSKKTSEFYWINPITENQKKFVKLMDEKQIVIADGCAGSGKTILTLQTGLKLLDLGRVDKIIYLRADSISNLGLKELGSLPGGLDEKLLPLLGPIQDNIVELCSPGKAKYILDNGLIEIIPMEYIRGRSFANSFIIIDEVQNCSIEVVKMVLTRISRNTQMVFIGDSNQKDSISRLTNGLSDAMLRFEDVDEIGILKFNLNDVIRSGIIKKILSKYTYK